MPIRLTEKAAQKIRERRQSEENPDNLVLRFSAKGGGCSGLSYGLELEKKERIEPHDKTFDSRGITIVVDPKSYIYVHGSEIDYQEKGLTGGFTIANPNEMSHCGCGTSFLPKKQPEK